VARDVTSESVQKSSERVFLPGRRNPVVLRQNSAPLLLLVAIRDEAHRFAIEYHRKLRNKEGIASGIDQIPGIGAKRRTALLKHFGSLQRLNEADLDEIAAVEGISRMVAQKVYEHLQGESNAQQ
jgi:excinuclease ABC subunit C